MPIRVLYAWAPRRDCEILMHGTPEGMRPALGSSPRVAANQASYTGQYLKQVFDRRRGAKTKRAAAAE
jgi:hypothetical protein